MSENKSVKCVPANLSQKQPGADVRRKAVLFLQNGVTLSRTTQLLAWL